tara:strand:+ start:6699 stop:7535 length:837 start_codon:yes stop_codon:yes gene_type:complete
MATPSIAHFGTTIIEAPPPEGVEQRDVPIEGALKNTLRFLEIFGFQPLIENFYPGMGRQYIWRRGEPGDVDYIEKDNFTSYRAEQRPANERPRVGDTVFRLTHSDPVGMWLKWCEEGLVRAADDAIAEDFVAGRTEWLLLTGPDGQHYELGPTQPTAAQNHLIYVWTAKADLEDVAIAYREHFGLEQGGREDFHGLGQVRLLRRAEPGVTVGLICRDDDVEPRWTDDIFVEAGYSHFRLGAVDMARTVDATREAFPSAGDVAFVYFKDSYLELVQANR